MKRLPFKPIVVVALTGLVIFLGLFVLKQPRHTNSLPLPVPNGYNDLIKAGQRLLPEPAVIDNLRSEELRSLVDGNAEALRLARAGLQKECRVPVVCSMSYMSNHLADLTLFKRLVRGFVAEGKLAELDNRQKSAALDYLDAIRLGHECGRGGVIIDALVGLACQPIGCQALQRLSNNLQAPDCREAIRQLEEMDSKAESVTEIINRERSWSRSTFGWRGQLARLMTSKSLRQTEQGVTAKLQAQERTARLLLIDLAARAYELDKRKRPTTVQDLMPNYLKAAPRDPVSGSEMIKVP
jgi:hypothetical protein